ncbi:LIM domain-containing protein [Cryptococcus neoformans Tu259-1]|uniref:LIM domain-containing protein n=1 Tax=Cryptococcus neoformans Tu259-1 TaxID=1230072 RepID=A0A854QEP5_CRYNE|nr:LIM domain-containing protein [Cryptococcus neoformans var. grubii AD1-83a]OXG24068.1 LIM domain-containing protein [Cryptococcus neoformans var. grubii Tu259-1]OXG42126.1 LIM domain-containing protein [Cryptococcus neoformans var. grubii MW-RSA1955]OXG46945.1 LIM domain-containing protein [Cryptococcus neoformans var. grubii CHC193]OXG56029.1 LIM domain-containing protein [Cryptococcus neoformans var. grubii c8]OXH00706.1 LIM domain-containing protein [Cryptococcus neoformans var. grubii A
MERRPPATVPIPQPVPKVAYEPPVFQTFQERRRARDIALRASASHPRLRDTLPRPPPPPAALAMMAAPDTIPGPPPVPPLRSRSPLPSSPSPSHAPSNTHDGQPSRPLPPPRVRTPLVANANPLPAPPPSAQYPPFTPSQPPQPSAPVPAAVETDLDRSDTLTSVKSLDRTSFSSPSCKRPLPKPPGGVNPSRSLDRGVAPSLAVGEGVVRRGAGRKQPSVVNEETEETLIDLPKSGNSSAGSHPPQALPRPYLPQQPAAIVMPDNTFQKNVDPYTPAKCPQLPAINIGDSDSPPAVSIDDGGNNVMYGAAPESKEVSALPVSPGIQFTGAPVIAVSSFDTADDMLQGGEISFSVPMINIESDPCASTKPLPLIASGPSRAPNPPRHQAHIHPNSAILCTGCQTPIIGRIVNAMNQRWHPHCFMCAECGELLEHVSSYEFEGKAYCHLDYHDKFAHHCHHCKTPIVEPRFITLDDEILGQRYYHELHFFCSECGDPFLDPSKSSAPGTEKGKQGGGSDGQEEDGETNEFVIHKGHPYCERCHLRLHKPKCKACTLPIPDVAISAMGAKWHKECFVCSRCHNDFANNIFFPRNGAAICTVCYEQVMS